MSMRVVCTLAVTAAFLFLFDGPVKSAETGKDIFLSQKCNKCHNIAAQNIAKLESEDDAMAEEDDLFGEEEEEATKPPDLSGVGKVHDGAWITQWIEKKIANDKGKKHKKRFKGTDEELKTLVTWLSGLKSDVAGK